MFFNKKSNKENEKKEDLVEETNKDEEVSNVSFDTTEIEDKNIDEKEELDASNDDQEVALETSNDNQEEAKDNFENEQEEVSDKDKKDDIKDTPITEIVSKKDISDNENIKKDKKKAKKEKQSKTQFVTNPITSYRFWFKIIGGVILLGLTFALIFVKTDNDQYLRNQLAVGIFGGIILVYAVIRTIPLFKTLEKGWSKGLNIIEVLVDVAVGAFLVSGGFNFSSSSSEYVKFVLKYFRFFLGGVLYLRGLVYCITSIIFGEKSDSKQFVANILCFTLGVAIFCLEKFNVSYLGWILVVLAALSGGYLVGEGSINYFNYRKEFAEKRDNKSKSDTKSSELGDKSKDENIDKQPNLDRDNIEKINPEIISDNDSRDNNLYS